MNIFYSIVIPVYNEEESLTELFFVIQKAFSKTKKTYEVIFVDDGSFDKSLETLKNLSRKFPEIKVYSFRKNLGKSYALMYGFQKAQGKFIATLDADLQDDPNNIRGLHEKLEREDLDMITGWRKERRDKQSKVLSSRMSNTLIAKLFKMKIHDLNCGLKVYRSDVAKDLKIYGGMHRFIPIIASEMGYKVGEKEVIHHARKYGYSKYKFSKIFTDIPDLVTIYFLTKYDSRPLHFFGKIGTFVAVAGFIILGYLAFIRFVFGESVGRRPLLITGIFLAIVGIQTIFTGLLADLIVNINFRQRQEFPVKYEPQIH